MRIQHMVRVDEMARHSHERASPKEPGGQRAAIDPAACARLDEALRCGDRERAIQLIDELFGASLFRFIHALVRNEDAADDLYQTTLLQAFRDLGTFEARSTVQTWLFGIARHRCLDALKSRKRRADRVVHADDLSEAADPAPGAAQLLTDAQLRASLGQCLDKLLPETRIVLVMRFSEGLSYDDISRICRVTPEALRARVARALPALRHCIEKTGTV